MTKEKEIKLNAVLNSLYECISFKTSGRPNLQRLKTLFVDGARLIRTDKDNITNMSVNDFILSYKSRIENGEIIEFSEFEISRKVDFFGRVVQVFSTYGTDLKTPNGRIKMRGINSIQLIEVEDDWKVVTILWYAEDSENKIPEEYLS
ncbi:hypothetical protein ACFLSS_02950 [Bacteroidota bacterium]